MNNEYIKTKSIRKPGEPGTKKLTQIYGNDLICVRYKYDYKLKKRYKTIELQIEETPWIPNKNDRFSKKPVYILVHYHEKNLREKLKKNGAIWNPDKKLWKVSLQIVLDLHIENRIIKFV